MTQLQLTEQEKIELKKAHKKAKKKRGADRIKAIILLGDGWTFSQISKVLLLDDETVRNFLKRYKNGGLKSLLNDSYKGYSGKLSEDEIMQLDEHLKENTYLRIQDIVAQVSKQYKVRYSISGMTELLHRLG